MGRQGVVTVGTILSAAALLEGKYAAGLGNARGRSHARRCHGLVIYFTVVDRIVPAGTLLKKTPETGP
jgi:Pyruvate/2-oxoacid:ferredoxin oxidoreductase gamma subunit